MFLPGESQGRGSLVGCRLWGRKSQTRLNDLAVVVVVVCFIYLPIVNI